jgi:hypothetical protein
VAILLLLLSYNEVLAFTLSVPSDKVAIGQTFPLSWTSTSNDQQNVDICLSTNTQFLPIGSIQRSGALAGTVDVTVNSNISPGCVVPLVPILYSLLNKFQDIFTGYQIDWLRVGP